MSKNEQVSPEQTADAVLRGGAQKSPLLTPSPVQRELLDSEKVPQKRTHITEEEYSKEHSQKLL